MAYDYAERLGIAAESLDGDVIVNDKEILPEEKDKKEEYDYGKRLMGASAARLEPEIVPDDEVARRVREFRKPKTWFGEFSNAFATGVDETQQTLYGAGALASDLVGFDSGKKYFMDKVIQQDKEMLMNPSSIEKVEDVEDFDTGMRYFLGQLGKAGPMIGESVATGVIGGMIGSSAGPEGTVLGGLAGVIERRAVRELIKDRAKGILKEELEDFATGKIAKETLSLRAKGLLKDQAKSIAGRIGATSAIAVNSVAQESGSIYTDLAKDPNISDADRKIAATVGGIIAAIPDTIVGGWIAGKFFPGAKKVTEAQTKEAGNFIAKYAKIYGKELLKVSPAEGGQEFIQTIVEEAAKNWADPKKREEILNFSPEQWSAVREGTIGGVVGGFWGAGVSSVGESMGKHPDPKVNTREAKVDHKTDQIVPPITATPADEAISEKLQEKAKLEAAIVDEKDTSNPDYIKAKARIAEIDKEIEVLDNQATIEEKVEGAPSETAPIPIESSGQDEAKLVELNSQRDVLNTQKIEALSKGDQATASEIDGKIAALDAEQDVIVKKLRVAEQSPKATTAAPAAATEKASWEYDELPDDPTWGSAVRNNVVKFPNLTGVVEDAKVVKGTGNFGEPSTVTEMKVRFDNGKVETIRSAIGLDPSIVGQRVKIGASEDFFQNLWAASIRKAEAPAATQSSTIAQEKPEPVAAFNPPPPPLSPEEQAVKDLTGLRQDRAPLPESRAKSATERLDVARRRVWDAVDASDTDMSEEAVKFRDDVKNAMERKGIIHMLADGDIQVMPGEWLEVKIKKDDIALYIPTYQVGKDKITKLDSAIEEEAIHIADAIGIRDEYNANKEELVARGYKTAEHYAKLVDKQRASALKNWWKNLSLKEQAGFPGIAAQLNAAYAPSEKKGSQAKDLELATEIPRMMVQLARTGRLNETTQALAQANEAAKGKGRIGVMFQTWIEALKNIHKTLKKLFDFETAPEAITKAYNEINATLDRFGALQNEKPAALVESAFTSPEELDTKEEVVEDESDKKEPSETDVQEKEEQEELAKEKKLLGFQKKRVAKLEADGESQDVIDAAKTFEALLQDSVDSIEKKIADRKAAAVSSTIEEPTEAEIEREVEKAKIAPEPPQPPRIATKPVDDGKPKRRMKRKAQSVNKAMDVLSDEDKAAAAKALGDKKWTKKTEGNFKKAFADWLAGTIQVGGKLLKAFNKVLNAIPRAVLSAIMVISPLGNIQGSRSGIVNESMGYRGVMQTSTEVYAEPALVSPDIDFDNIPGIQFDYKPSLPNQYKGPSTQLIITLPKVAPSSTIPVADFRAGKPSKEVAQMANWVVANKDNGGSAFIVADKENGTSYLFSPDGKLKEKFPALFGADKGDVLMGSSLEGAKKITPAGRYETEIDEKENEEADEEGFKYGATIRLLDENGDYVVSVHRLYDADPTRESKLKSSNPDLHRASYGCINMDKKLFMNTVMPMARENGMVTYILPEETTVTPMIEELAEDREKMVDEERGGMRAGGANLLEDAAGKVAFDYLNSQEDSEKMHRGEADWKGLLKISADPLHYVQQTRTDLLERDVDKDKGHPYYDIARFLRDASKKKLNQVASEVARAAKERIQNRPWKWPMFYKRIFGKDAPMREPEPIVDDTERGGVKAGGANVEQLIDYGNDLISMFPDLKNTEVMSAQEAWRKRRNHFAKSREVDRAEWKTEEMYNDVQFGRNGWSALYDLDTDTIVVGPLTTYSDIAHEVGHSIQEHALKNAPKEVQDQIKKDYEKDISAKRKTNFKVADAARNWERMKDWGWDRANEKTSAIQPYDPYVTGFSEWFADQVSHWATTSEKPRTLVEKFFTDVAEQMKKLWNEIKQYFSPTDTLSSWLDSMARPPIVDDTERGGMRAGGLILDDNAQFAQDMRANAYTTENEIKYLKTRTDKEVLTRIENQAAMLKLITKDEIHVWDDLVIPGQKEVPTYQKIQIGLYYAEALRRGLKVPNSPALNRYIGYEPYEALNDVEDIVDDNAERGGVNIGGMSKKTLKAFDALALQAADQTRRGVTVLPDTPSRTKIRGGALKVEKLEDEASHLNPATLTYQSQPHTESAARAHAIMDEYGLRKVVEDLLATGGNGLNIVEDTAQEPKDRGPGAVHKNLYELALANLQHVMREMDGDISYSYDDINEVNGTFYELEKRMRETHTRTGQFNSATGKMMQFWNAARARALYIDPILEHADKIFGKGEGRNEIDNLRVSLNRAQAKYIDGAMSHPEMIAFLREMLKNVHTRKWQQAYRKESAMNPKQGMRNTRRGGQRAAEHVLMEEDGPAQIERVIGGIVKSMANIAKAKSTRTEFQLFETVVNAMALYHAEEMGIMSDKVAAKKATMQEKFTAIFRNENLYSLFNNNLRSAYIKEFGGDIPSDQVLEEADELFSRLSQKWTPDMVSDLMKEKMQIFNKKFYEIAKEAYKNAKDVRKQITDNIRTYLKSQGVTNEPLIQAIVNDIEGAFDEQVEAARKKFLVSPGKIADALRDAGTTLTRVAKEHTLKGHQYEKVFATYVIRELGFPEDVANKFAALMQAKLNEKLDGYTDSKGKYHKGERQKVYERWIASTKTDQKTKTKLANATEQVLQAAATGALRTEDTYEAVRKKFDVLPPWKQETADEIDRMAFEIAESHSEHDLEIRIQELSHFLQSQRGIETKDMLIAGMYFSMLSGPSTQMVNIAANFTSLLGYAAVQATRSPRKIPTILRAIFRTATGSGYWEARESFWTGIQLGKEGDKYYSGAKPLEHKDPVFVSKYEEGWKRTADVNLAKFLHWTITKLRGKVVGRLLSAMDIYFYKIAQDVAFSVSTTDFALGNPQAWESSMHEARSLVEARGEDPDTSDKAKVRMMALAHRIYEKNRIKEFPGIPGSTGEQAVEQRAKIKAAWDEAHRKAVDVTFTQEPKGWLGMLAGYIEKFSNNQPWAKLIVPFTRVAANVTNAMLEWTPIGLMRWHFSKDFKIETIVNGKTELKKDHDIAIRALLGMAGMIVLQAVLADQDEDDPWFAIYADGPRDRNAKRQLMERGWKPFSIKVGDNYWSYIYTPIGMVTAMVGRLWDDYRDGKVDKPSATNVNMGSMVAAMFELVTEQSFLASISDILSISDSPDPIVQLEKMAARTGTVIVPNFFKQMDKIIDPSIQEADGFWQTWIKELPIARSKSLTQMLNVFGEPISRTPGVVPWVPGMERFVTEVKKGDEVWNLMGTKRVVVPGYSEGSKLNKVKMTQEQYYEYVQTAGPRVKDAIKAEINTLKAMPRDEVQDRVRKISEKVKEQVRKEMASKYYR